MNNSDRIIPLPCLPTYSARRPVRSRSDAVDTVKPYNPIILANWHKASHNHVSHYHGCVHSPFINNEIEHVQTSPKQYDSYKPTFYPRIEYNLTDTFDRIRPLSVPVHTTRTSQKWSRFLDEFPDRFNIRYPEPDNENHFYVQNRPGRYPCQTNQDPITSYGGLVGPIQPVANTFRQFEPHQMSARPAWIPYGSTPRSYQLARN
ncbi:unnamed protein product [Adineta steineri]|uniref:Uncharacterized protein n=1 Tax=Adineta steineri TaxID=433720 RepID=A0A814W2Q9_9BILA|nr:unnamed protein product [Adineta steineri]CAF4022041.1 unnamed protein product [Adineta steineri]